VPACPDSEKSFDSRDNKAGQTKPGIDTDAPTSRWSGTSEIPCSDKPGGADWYDNGVNKRAIWALAPALLAGVVITLSGIKALADFNWFIGCALGALFHHLATKGRTASHGSLNAVAAVAPDAAS
jgi:hypothetical protein